MRNAAVIDSTAACVAGRGCKPLMYINRETGELLTRREMLKQFAEDYDGNDPTNAVSWAEYFGEVHL